MRDIYYDDSPDLPSTGSLLMALSTEWKLEELNIFLLKKKSGKLNSLI